MEDVRMTTEFVSERFAEIDLWPTAIAVEAMLEGQMAAIAAVRPAMQAIAAAADQAAIRLQKGGRLIYVGAGSSGRIAAQDGAELKPTFGWPADRLRLVVAGGLEALASSVEKAEDDAIAGQTELRGLDLARDDVVVAVAASGRTRFTVAALVEARRAGALAIGIANNPGTPLLAEADIAICAETGGEAIAGSTRMKAGTAQKVILNLFSTAVMIRCGRVYRGRMVEMVVSNDKLMARAISMVAELAGSPRVEAEAALAATKGNIKTAILCAMGARPDEASELLKRSGGFLRGAVAEIKGGRR